jgi:4-hydroxybenzoate polyprenyltransferase
LSPMSFLRFLTSSSLYLALNGSLVVVLAYSLYGIEISIFRLIGAFLATFSTYSLNKVTDRIEDAVNRPEVVAKGTKRFLVSSMAAMFLGLVIGAMDGAWVVAVLVIPLVIGLVYSVRLSERVPRLKEVVGVKSFCVAFSWALAGSLLPEIMHSVLFEEVVLVFLYIFVSLLVNTILFDVLDVEGDSVSGVKTIPLVFGLSRTKKVLFGANTCLVVWVAYCLWRGLFLDFMPSLVFGVLYGYFIIGYFLNHSCKRLMVELMVDGEWFPLVTVLRLFSK